MNLWIRLLSADQKRQTLCFNLEKKNSLCAVTRNTVSMCTYSSLLNGQFPLEMGNLVFKKKPHGCALTYTWSVWMYMFCWLEQQPYPTVCVCVWALFKIHQQDRRLTSMCRQTGVSIWGWVGSSMVTYHIERMAFWSTAWWVIEWISPRCSGTECMKSWSGRQGCAELFPGCWRHTRSSFGPTEAEGGYELAEWLVGPSLQGPGCQRWGGSEGSPAETQRAAVIPIPAWELHSEETLLIYCFVRNVAVMWCFTFRFHYELFQLQLWHVQTLADNLQTKRDQILLLVQKPTNTRLYPPYLTTKSTLPLVSTLLSNVFHRGFQHFSDISKHGETHQKEKFQTGYKEVTGK